MTKAPEVSSTSDVRMGPPSVARPRGGWDGNHNEPLVPMADPLPWPDAPAVARPGGGWDLNHNEPIVAQAATRPR